VTVSVIRENILLQSCIILLPPVVSFLCFSHTQSNLPAYWHCNKRPTTCARTLRHCFKFCQVRVMCDLQRTVITLTRACSLHSMDVKTKVKETEKQACIMYQPALASCRPHTRHVCHFVKQDICCKHTVACLRNLNS
jgi:hypothetical protein